MILFFVIGLIGVFVLLFMKRPLIDMIGENNKLLKKLRNARWFQNYWFSGFFLFGMNAILFFSTCLILYLLMYLIIPFIHLLVMILAVIGSIYLWIIIHKSWQGTNRNRMMLGGIGSSFYVILFALFIYLSGKVKPSYPGEDTFMQDLGLFLGAIVAIIAFLTCFIITGFSNKKPVK